MTKNHNYDIALSFAGEDRDYVEKVAAILKRDGVRVFYDRFEETELWGKDLYAYLSDIYQNRARFTVMFISLAYADKLWTNHERKAAQARAFQEAQEYILPARFDDTALPGMLPTIGYIPLQDRSPEDLASLISKKLVSAGITIPTELVRQDFSTVAQISGRNASKLSVAVRDDAGMPISSCNVTVLADNGTSKSLTTTHKGLAVFELKVRRPSTLLVSHPRFPAAILEKVDTEGTVQLDIARTDDIGSIVIHRTGYIPGLQGRLSPILDTSGRTYLYANNIAIDGGEQQPVPFNISVPFQLEDADGTVVVAAVKYIAADVSLIQYTRKHEV
ncbi:MAG: TIR domain-containing protein [Pseudomonadota bacterium]